MVYRHFVDYCTYQDPFTESKCMVVIVSTLGSESNHDDQGKDDAINVVFLCH